MTIKKLKLSSELEWMRPYIKKVSHIVPLHLLHKVNSYRPRKSNLIHEQASYNIDKLDGRISKRYISMNLYSWKLISMKEVKREIIPFSKVDLLGHLAHELAHMIDFYHTPRHKKIECRIYTIFMTMLENTGYISEEHEFKHNKPKF